MCILLSYRLLCKRITWKNVVMFLLGAQFWIRFEFHAGNKWVRLTRGIYFIKWAASTCVSNINVQCYNNSFSVFHTKRFYILNSQSFHSFNFVNGSFHSAHDRSSCFHLDILTMIWRWRSDISQFEWTLHLLPIMINRGMSHRTFHHQLFNPSSSKTINKYITCNILIVCLPYWEKEDFTMIDYILVDTVIETQTSL